MKPSRETLIEHATLLANGTLTAKREIEWRAKVLAHAFLAEWTPVASALPDDDITVMVACKDCDEPVWFGYHDENGWWSATDGVPLTKLVTHWRPVIEGPTKEDRRATGIR